jgi:hypothetical protein
VGGGKGGDEARVSWWGPRAAAEIRKAAVVRAVHRFLGLTNYTVRLEASYHLVVIYVHVHHKKCY